MPGQARLTTRVVGVRDDKERLEVILGTYAEGEGDNRGRRGGQRREARPTDGGARAGQRRRTWTRTWSAPSARPENFQTFRLSRRRPSGRTPLLAATARGRHLEWYTLTQTFGLEPRTTGACIRAFRLARPLNGPCCRLDSRDTVMILLRDHPPRIRALPSLLSSLSTAPSSADIQ